MTQLTTNTTIAAAPVEDEDVDLSYSYTVMVQLIEGPPPLPPCRHLPSLADVAYDCAVHIHASNLTFAGIHPSGYPGSMLSIGVHCDDMVLTPDELITRVLRDLKDYSPAFVGVHRRGENTLCASWCDPQNLMF